MFRPVMAIVRLPWKYLRTNCKLYRAHNVEISTCSVSSITQQYGATVPHSDLGVTPGRKYHNTDTTEEWQLHNHISNTVSTHRTVTELASHIKFTSKTSNITAPNKKTRWWIQTHRYAALGRTKEGAPPGVPHPTRATRKHGRTYQHTRHRKGNSHAQGHSNPSYIIAQPRKNREQRTQDFTPGSILPQLRFFVYITFILGRCLFNY